MARLIAFCLFAAGKLPWDALSESSDEDLSPRQVRQKKTEAGPAHHPEEEEERQANGHTPKAPAPEPAAAFTKQFTLADSIAFGTKEMAERLQVCFLVSQLLHSGL